MSSGLVLDALACDRGGRRLFAGLSAVVEPGSALILRGPNGAGKSSLMRAVAGFASPSQGDARFAGVSRRKDPAAFQAHVLYAGHLDALKPTLTAEETLRFWARLYGADPDRAPQALDALGLGALWETPAQYLSAGQKRRLGLARLALIDRPLWLLDEPTVSLDAESSARIAQMARARCASGGVVVAATHIDLGLPEAQSLDIRDFPPARGADAFAADFMAEDGF